MKPVNKTINVGLIKGRHPMPVDSYLINESNVPFADAHRMAYDAMTQIVMAEPEEVNLYITGLTRATLGAIAAWQNYYSPTRYIPCGYTDPLPNPRTLRIWEWNAETGEYESVISYVASAHRRQQDELMGAYEFIWSTTMITRR